MTDESEADGAHEGTSLEVQAADWCTKMHGHDAALHRKQFDAWIREDPSHLAAFNGFEEMYLNGDRAKRSAVLVEPLPRDEQPEPTAPPASFGRKRIVAIAAALAALIAIAVVIRAFYADAAHHAVTTPVMAGNSIPSEQGQRVLRAEGTGARFSLVDGSAVTLEPRSTVRVEFSQAQRQLALLGGSARFEVAHEARPFNVTAGGGTVMARGTIFEVAIAGAQVAVKLIQGVIDVKLPERGRDAPSPIKQMQAGDRLTYDIAVQEVAAPPTQAPPPAATVPAEQPKTVGDLVAQTNAQHDGGDRLVLADPMMAGVPLSGTFTVHDPATVADRLGIILGLHVDRTTAGVLLLK